MTTMKPEAMQRDRQALEIFGQALERADAEALATYLDDACGGVYMAEQQEPVRRKVSLKLIRPLSSASVRPFFVMELVRGLRITDCCRDHALDTRARLDLFTAGCSAVQHAHQKGVIHRDLKPSNILVNLYQAWDKPDKASEWREKLAAFDKTHAAPAAEAATESSRQ